MEPPLLTFDLDGVLCRPPLGVNPGTGHGKQRNAPGHRGILWLTERWRYLGRRPMPGAVEGVRLLSNTFRWEVVTARSEVARTLTEQWFRRHFGVTPVIHMRPHWRETSAQFKARMVTALQPMAHFEDDPFTAAWVAELCPRVFLVDWPRNRALAGENILRVASVREAATRHLLGAANQSE